MEMPTPMKNLFMVLLLALVISGCEKRPPCSFEIGVIALHLRYQHEAEIDKECADYWVNRAKEK